MSSVASVRSRLLAAALTLMIFAAGAVVGAAVDRRWLRPGVAEQSDRRPRTGRAGDRGLARFRKRLDLSDAQSQQIGAIIDRVRRQVRDVRAGSESEIVKLLNPEQAEKYREMLERRKRRWNHRRKRHDRDQGRHGRFDRAERDTAPNGDNQ